MNRRSLTVLGFAVVAIGLLATATGRWRVRFVQPVASKAIGLRRASSVQIDGLDERKKKMADWRAQIAAVNTPVERHALLVAFAADDVLLAMDLARSATLTAAARYAAICDILREWTKAAPRDAWVWARENSAALTPGDDIPLFAVCLNALATSDPALALRLADESLSTPDGAGVAVAAVNALLEKGHADQAREKIKAWATDPSMTAAVGDGVFKAFALYIARDSDLTAARWVLELPPFPGRGSAMAVVAAEWANHDPAAALAWAQSLSIDEGRAEAMGRAFRVWADHGSVPAAEWLLDHEALPEGDRMIAEFVGGSEIADGNPQAALQWVSLIRDHTLRQQGFTLVLERWADHDRPAALRFLAENKSTLSTPPGL